MNMLHNGITTVLELDAADSRSFSNRPRDTSISLLSSIDIEAFVFTSRRMLVDKLDRTGFQAAIVVCWLI